jgi:hypothetical protein
MLHITKYFITLLDDVEVSLVLKQNGIKKHFTSSKLKGKVGGLKVKYEIDGFKGS